MENKINETFVVFCFLLGSFISFLEIHNLLSKDLYCFSSSGPCNVSMFVTCLDDAGQDKQCPGHFADIDWIQQKQQQQQQPK